MRGTEAVLYHSQIPVANGFGIWYVGVSVTLPERTAPMSRLTESMEMMDKFLSRNDYPAVIKAHYLISVLLPRLMAEVGIKECTAEMTRHMAKGLAAYSGYCTICCKVPAVVEDLCGVCKREFNELCAEMDAP